MADSLAHRWSWARVGLLAAALAMLGERAHAFLAAPPTDFDDAFMFARYAHNLTGGHGLAWNPGGPATYGATSLGHLLLVTALHALVPVHDDARILRLASVLAALAVLVAMAALAARALAPAEARLGRGTRYPLALVLVTAACGYTDAFWFHARTGMDTMLAALATAGVAGAALRLGERPTPARAWLAALAAEAALLARPDLALVAAGVPACVLLLAAPPPRGRAALVFGLAAAALFALDLGLRARLWGSALPLPYYAKRPGAYAGFAGEYGWNPFLFLRVFLAAAAPLLVVVLAGVRRGSVRLVAALALPAAATLAASFSERQIMGHLGRFYFPLLPLAVAAAALALADALAPPRPSPKALLARVAGALALAAAGHLGLGAAGAAFDARAANVKLAPIDDPPTAGPPLPELDTWQAGGEVAEILAAAPAGTRVAMSEHGLPGARAPQVIIDDVLGLHDAVFAHGFSADELFRRAPDAIWMPHPDHTQMLRQILDHPDFRAHYLYYPGAFAYGFALRRDGSRFAALDRAFRARFALAYPGRTPEEAEAR